MKVGRDTHNSRSSQPEEPKPALALQCGHEHPACTVCTLSLGSGLRGSGRPQDKTIKGDWPSCKTGQSQALGAAGIKQQNDH